jgi:hypothetical protein
MRVSHLLLGKSLELAYDDPGSDNHNLLDIDYTGTVQSISIDLETNMLR